MELLLEIIARLALLAQGSWELLTARLKVVRWTYASGGAVLLAAGVCIALVLALVCYYHTKEGLTLRSRFGLAGLRFVAILALLIMASGMVCAVDVATRR